MWELLKLKYDQDEKPSKKRKSKDLKKDYKEIFAKQMKPSHRWNCIIELLIQAIIFNSQKNTCLSSEALGHGSDEWKHKQDDNWKLGHCSKFLDVPASLDLKLSVIQWVIRFWLAHPGAFHPCFRTAQWVTLYWLYFTNWGLWSLRHLFKVMRKHDLRTWPDFFYNFEFCLSIFDGLTICDNFWQCLRHVIAYLLCTIRQS